MTKQTLLGRAWLRAGQGPLVACLVLNACGGHVISEVPTPLGARGPSFAALSSAGRGVSPDAGAKTKIKHIIIVIQENRTLDNLFHGFKGAKYVSSGKNSKGQTIALTQAPLAYQCNITHQFPQAIQDVDYPAEKMDGFDKNPASGSGCSANPAYTYTKQSDVQKYWDMAHQYVLADKFFSSQLDGSFAGHQYLIAGQSEMTYGIPSNGSIWGCDGGANNHLTLLDPSTKPGTMTTNTIQACFDPPVTQGFDTTLADELDAKHLTWRYYAPGFGQDAGYIWSAFDAINHIRNGPEWTTNVISPPKQFITDVQAGTLLAVTWIAPILANSDHPATGATNQGPGWVASLVDAVGNSQFWNSSVIFVTWDDWGALYDSVPPPLLDYDGLGMRVPLIAISPYSLKGKVTHNRYEFGSILKFVETTYGLPALTQATNGSDARAANFGIDTFNFKKQPRSFQPFATRQERAFYQTTQQQSLLPPDDDF